LTDGAKFTDRMAVEPGVLKAKILQNGQTSLQTTMPISAKLVVQNLAEMDVALASMQGKSTSIESAIGARSKDKVEGTIDVTFEVEESGSVTKMMRIVTFSVINTQGETYGQKETQTIVRERVN
jgi:hypothetical protein